MGTKSCGKCAGMGTQIEYETVPDYSPGSGPLYKTITKNVRCSGCGGTGYIVTYDPPSSYVKPRNKSSPNSGEKTLLGGNTSKPIEIKRRISSSPDLIEEWFDRKFPKDKRRAFNYLFCGVGAFLAYIIAPIDAVVIYTITGSLIGLFLIAILYYMAKLLYFSFLLVIIGGALFIGYKVISSLFP